MMTDIIMNNIIMNNICLTKLKNKIEIYHNVVFLLVDSSSDM